MERKVVRLPVMMEPRMVQSIDDWSFSNRVRTRAGAVRALIDQALAAETVDKEKVDARS